MSFLLAVFVVVSFAAVVEVLGLPSRAREVGRRAGSCLDLLRDPSLDDDQKEQGLRRESLHLFRLLGQLTGGSLLALCLPLLTVWGLGRLGISSLGEVLAVLERLDFLVGATVLGLVVFLVARRIFSA